MIKVLVNGAFDLLHTGHIDLLNYAKLEGDYLLVALDTCLLYTSPSPRD